MPAPRRPSAGPHGSAARRRGPEGPSAEIAGVTPPPRTLRSLGPVQAMPFIEVSASLRCDRRPIPDRRLTNVGGRSKAVGAKRASRGDAWPGPCRPQAPGHRHHPVDRRPGHPSTSEAAFGLEGVSGPTIRGASRALGLDTDLLQERPREPDRAPTSGVARPSTVGKTRQNGSPGGETTQASISGGNSPNFGWRKSPG